MRKSNVRGRCLAKLDVCTTSDPNRDAIIDVRLPLGNAGLDRIPHELWRHLADKHEKLVKIDKPPCNLYRLLSLVFNDIHGPPFPRVR